MGSKIVFVIGGLLLAAFTGMLVFEGLRQKTIRFDERLQTIAKDVNAKGSTWKAGVNSKWVNSDIAGVKAQMGVLLKKSSGVKLTSVDNSSTDLPENFDARQEWGWRCPSLWEVRD